MHPPAPAPPPVPISPPPASTEAGAASSPASAAEASTRELVAYSLPDSANVLVAQTSNYLITPVLVSVLLVNPEHVGLALMVRGLWDAITDPLMGHLTDNTRSRHGRRRPYIALGGLLTALSLLAIWAFPRGASTGHVAWHVGVALLVFATAQTVFSVPYGALALELSPSYHGRTRVQLFRAWFSRVPGFIGPYLLPFCLLPFFTDALQGVRWLASASALLFAVAALVAFRGTRERARVPAAREPFFPAVRATLRSVHFLKISFIYVALLFTLGAFGSFQYFLTVYYVFQGDMARGATFAAHVETFANVLVLAGIPLVGWASRRFQKHNALRAALALMVAGSALQLVLLDPERPWLMFVSPFFYSLGIASTFVVLGTMLADVVDVDELESGRRREGLFGAIAAFMMKSVGAFAAGASGFLIAWTGFRAELGGAQAPGVFDKMLWLFAGKGLLLLGCLFVLHRYPLTEERITRIQAELRRRQTSA